MDLKEKKPAKMSVPQFGGWDQTAPGATTDYSMVFTQARANKKQMKTDLTQVKRNSLGNERDLVNANHARAHHAHANARAAAAAQANANANEEPVVMGKRRILTYINCCIRP